MPHPGEGESLAHALWHEWPSYFGFALSFVVIGIMWINHHTMFRDIERIDHWILVLNLLLLMSIAFLPFPTAVLADHLRESDGRLTATLLYGGTCTTNAIAWNALWLYVASHRELLDHHVRPERLRSRTRRNILGPVFYGLTLPLALISPWISLGIYTGLAILYLLPMPYEPLSEDSS